ncbi:DUF4488 domain-containing protein [Arachidicoccus sp.]|uniref:DUF4488 domain-containing protein n=1 Tax=Arachidicoccus sp. TaxID=1872624 RepID=UPI003D262A12
MRSLVIYVFLLVASTTCGYNACAQKPKISNKSFEGVWQVSMQKSPAGSDKFLPPHNNDFKIFDADGNFRHIFYLNNKYVELSNGKIEITSDSTYTEHLNRHIAVPSSIKEGKIIFHFLDENTFLMKWELGKSNGQEIYERVR